MCFAVVQQPYIHLKFPNVWPKKLSSFWEGPFWPCLCFVVDWACLRESTHTPGQMWTLMYWYSVSYNKGLYLNSNGFSMHSTVPYCRLNPGIFFSFLCKCTQTPYKSKKRKKTNLNLHKRTHKVHFFFVSVEMEIFLQKLKFLFIKRKISEISRNVHIHYKYLKNN